MLIASEISEGLIEKNIDPDLLPEATIEEKRYYLGVSPPRGQIHGQRRGERTSKMQISIIVKIKKCSVFYHRYDWDH
jgi:hypothetical protein